jgi:hypothetical protein
MVLTDSQVEDLKRLTQIADEADKRWEDVVSALKHNRTDDAIKKMREAREDYYQEAARVHLLIRTILKEAEQRI